MPARSVSPPLTASASFAQERMWFLEKLVPGNPAFNIVLSVAISGPMSAPSLHVALGEIVGRHEALRTRIVEVDGRPVQVIAAPGGLPVRVVDLRRLSHADARVATGAVERLEARRPFSLHAGPLVRACLFLHTPTRHVLLVSVHHIVFDVWSLGILFRELTASFDRAVRGEPSRLPAPALQHRTYAAWQRQRFPDDRVARDLPWWRDYLSGVPGSLDLPADRPRPLVRRGEGRTTQFALPADLVGRVRDLAASAKVTPFVVWLAAWQTLLHRYTGHASVLTGTPVAGRTEVEHESAIGLFVNIVVLRADFDGDPTFRELLARLGRTTREVFARQGFPFDRLVTELQPARDASRTPVIQVWFAYQNIRIPALALGPAAAMPTLIDPGTAKFDLSLFVSDADDAPVFSLEYDTDLFDEARIARLAGHWLTLLAAAVEHPESRASVLPVLPAHEAAALNEWNATAHDWGTTDLIPAVIRRQVRKTPDAIAISFEGTALTYRELDRRSRRLASVLAERGVVEGTAVGIAMERSVELVVAILAALAAGAAYVPLDLELPADRMTAMIARSAVRIVLTSAAGAGSLSFLDVPLAVVDEHVAGDARTFRRPVLFDESLAYTIFTSGSTGQPKAAMNTHAALSNRLLWMQKTFGLTASDRVLQKTPFGFDVSVWEFLWPLMTGATLVVARPGGHRDPAYLQSIAFQEQITTVHFVPSMLRAFLAHPASVPCRSLRVAIASGEALGADVRERFHQAFAASLHNLYGPTEAAIDVSHWPCERTGGPTAIPIGTPITNVSLEALDGRMERVPVGVPGELYIGGIALARGYANDPAETAARFAPDPFASRPGARLYRTGDLVRRRPDGAFEYLGRIDGQVKIRGVRVELGEIEASLFRHPDVTDAAAAVHVTDDGEPVLVAYVVCDGGEASAAGLRDHVRTWLPESMMPGRFVFLDRLPVTPNGKLDRRRLPRPAEPAPAAEFVAPRTPTEEVIAGFFGELLHRAHVGADDNFFVLGGHSLLATQLVSRVREHFGVEVSMQRFFAAPTVSATSAHVLELRLDEPGAESIRTLLAQLDGLTDEELMALVERRPAAAEARLP